MLEMPTKEIEGSFFVSVTSPLAYDRQCNNYRPCQLCSQANIECKEAANKRRRSVFGWM